MALHTDLPIYATGVKLLNLAIQVQQQMPRGVKRSLGDKISQHCAVVLLPAKPSKRLHWQAALDWAAEQQAELPTRPVAALLFANLKPQFEEVWHWTSEAFDGSYAWFQDFDDGYQYYGGHKSYEGRARAVRRFVA